MKNKTFAVSLFVIMLVPNLVLAQQLTHPYIVERMHMFGGQSEKSPPIFDQSSVLGAKVNKENHDADTEILDRIIDDFQVNENEGSTGAMQWSSAISIDGNGNFVITWSEYHMTSTDLTYSDIYAQRYLSDGTALGTNFKVNDNQFTAQHGYPSVATDDSGNFVITWYDRRNGYWNIYAQLYSSDGEAIGANFKVNDDQENKTQGVPCISMESRGSFVITWADERNGNRDIYAQRYSSSGAALGPNFKVNDDSGRENQTIPVISHDTTGNFVIAWMDRRVGGSEDIYAQRYTVSGFALGPNFKVNDDEGYADQYSPVISSNNDGNFVIAWMDRRNKNNDIYAQRYSSDGDTIGINIKVNSGYYPSICSDDSGNFVVTWQANNGDIRAQRYSRDGTPLGTDFKMQNESSQGSYPSIATNDNGNFVIAWDDNRNGDYDIYAQRYSGDGMEIGVNFKVNDEYEGNTDQYYSSIATDDSGNFVIIWLDQRNRDTEIYAQRYSTEGRTRGTNIKIIDSVFKYRPPSISSDDSGNFVVTWQAKSIDIYAQRYSSDGRALGTEILVSNRGSGSIGYPDIATDGNGNFMITWYGFQIGNSDIYARLFSKDGTKLGGSFRVNERRWVMEDEKIPSICALGSDGFVIVWDEGSSLYAQRYSSDGIVLGTNFIVTDTLVYTILRYPSISSDDNGNFVIAWRDRRFGSWDIYAQRYSSDGTALGANFKVNDDAAEESRGYLSIAMNRNGDFLIAWADARNGDFDIYAQRYTRDGAALGSNFRMTKSNKKRQTYPDIRMWNNRIYCTWTDNHTELNGYDIWANVLDWENPTEIKNTERHQLPKEFFLYQNYPNPFNPATRIKYKLSESSYLTLKIYNLAGQEIATLVNEFQPAGQYEITWQPKGLPSGLYFYKIQAGDFSETRKFILQK